MSRSQKTTPERRTSAESSPATELELCWVFPNQREPLPLDGARKLLGRDDDCDATLSGSEVSRHHAELRRDGPIWLISDLDSTNGTFVDGARVTRAPIGLGSVVRVGEWIAIVVAQATEHGVRRLAERVYGGSRLSALLEPVRRGAATDLPIVLEGETGTGKECVARAIHEWSGRPGSYVAVNCAALPEALTEAELFGYRKGAFTGASHDSRGWFRAADGGTLLLDELTDLPLSLQPKLLRAIEERQVTPLGEARALSVDVRLVAATQESLEGAVQAGRFRRDLYARLSGISLRLPPLRERLEDVPGLFSLFLERHGSGAPPRLSPRLVERLCLYDWPLNVRELELVARQLLALHPDLAELRRRHLPERIAGIAAAEAEPDHPAEPAADLEQLIDALRRHGGNLARAAAELGITRQRAYRWVEGAGIDLARLRSGGEQ
jgi:DNA-binding NtrC family response regulator